MVNKFQGRKPHDTGDHQPTLDGQLHGTQAEEQRRCDKWNYTYDFGNAASTVEKELEATRREQHAERLAYAQSQVRLVPSIQTAPQNRYRPRPAGSACSFQRSQIP